MGIWLIKGKFDVLRRPNLKIAKIMFRGPNIFFKTDIKIFEKYIGASLLYIPATKELLLSTGDF